VRAKNVGKKIVGKSAKKVFIFTQISLPKNGGEKTRETIFQKHKNSAKKNVGKKIDGKICEKRFLYSHEYRDQKMLGTKRAKKFMQKHTISASKKCLEKNRRKKV